MSNLQGDAAEDQKCAANSASSRTAEKKPEIDTSCDYFPISLAHASEKELCLLPGIGEQRAQAILRLCSTQVRVTLDHLVRETHIPVGDWVKLYLGKKIWLFFDPQVAHEIFVTPVSRNDNLPTEESEENIKSLHEKIQALKEELSEVQTLAQERESKLRQDLSEQESYYEVKVQREREAYELKITQAQNMLFDECQQQRVHFEQEYQRLQQHYEKELGDLKEELEGKEGLIQELVSARKSNAEKISAVRRSVSSGLPSPFKNPIVGIQRADKKPESPVGKDGASLSSPQKSQPVPGGVSGVKSEVGSQTKVQFVKTEFQSAPSGIAFPSQQGYTQYQTQSGSQAASSVSALPPQHGVPSQPSFQTACLVSFQPPQCGLPFQHGVQPLCQNHDRVASFNGQTAVSHVHVTPKPSVFGGPPLGLQHVTDQSLGVNYQDNLYSIPVAENDVSAQGMSRTFLVPPQQQLGVSNLNMPMGQSAPYRVSGSQIPVQGEGFVGITTNLPGENLTGHASVQETSRRGSNPVRNRPSPDRYFGYCQQQSEESEEEYEEWYRPHRRQARRRSKSPPRPKMPTFSGEENDWESFIYQFDRIAARQGWDTAKKGSRLIDCLSGCALDYVVKHQLSGYCELVRCLERRFNVKDPPSAARRQVSLASQTEDESIEEFSQRIYSLTVDAYPKARRSTVDDIAVEAFLKGCRDKPSAEVTLDKEPRSVEEALRLMNTASANRQALSSTAKSGN